MYNQKYLYGNEDIATLHYTLREIKSNDLFIYYLNDLNSKNDTMF